MLELSRIEHAAGDREDAQFVVPVVAAPVRGFETLFHSQSESTQQTISDRQHEQQTIEPARLGHSSGPEREAVPVGFLVAKHLFDRHPLFIETSQPQRRGGQVGHEIERFCLRALHHDLLNDRILFTKLDGSKHVALTGMNLISLQQTDMLYATNTDIGLDADHIIDSQLLAMPGQIGFAKPPVGQDDDLLSRRQELVKFGEHLLFEPALRAEESMLANGFPQHRHAPSSKDSDNCECVHRA